MFVVALAVDVLTLNWEWVC